MTDVSGNYREKRDAAENIRNKSKPGWKRCTRLGNWPAEERIEAFILMISTYTEMKPWTKTAVLDFGLDEKNLGNEGVLCGYGNVDGRPVFAYANDVTIMGGSMGEAGRDKIIVLKAIEAGYPILTFKQCGQSQDKEGIWPFMPIVPLLAKPVSLFRMDSANLFDPGDLCRRNIVLRGFDRFYHSSKPNRKDVCYRSGGDEVGDEKNHPLRISAVPESTAE